MEPDYLRALNEKQKEAVLATDGPLLIVAGAGAGKTKTITHRILHLIHQGIAPQQILAITFTNKAAAEMRERIHKLLAGERLDRFPHISTFHSLGVLILKENAALTGRTKHFAILDENDAMKLIKESIVESDLDPKQYEPRRMKGIISREKGDFVTLAKYEEKAETSLEKIVVKVWRRYEAKIQEEHAFDFDDLLLESVLLLRKHEDIRDAYRKRFTHIHIDEYQDTNEVQYELTKLLVGEEKNICVVGDTDQNIYSWRGANIKNMLHFEKDFPNAKIVFLEQNYRSTKTILEAANRVIEKNTVRVPKNLFTENHDGENISVYEGYDERDEAEFIVEKCRALIESGVEPSEIAVLYRANFQSRVLEEAFLDAQLPYQVLGVKFYDRKEIKDILSYIRAALNRDGLSDLKRIINMPPRGIGKTTIAKVFSGMRNELPAGMQKKLADFDALLEKIHTYVQENIPSAVVRYVITETGIEEHLKKGTAEDLERLENIREMASLAVKYDVLPPGEGIEKLIEDAALASDQDTLIEKTAGVRLMTVHASKGLEFNYVFVAGLEQDLFPHARHGDSKREDREEERRLFYVALTRAAKKVFLSYATIRTIFGARQMNTPSEFLYDIPENLVEHESRSSGKIKTIYI